MMIVEAIMLREMLFIIMGMMVYVVVVSLRIVIRIYKWLSLLLYLGLERRHDVVMVPPKLIKSI